MRVAVATNTGASREVAPLKRFGVSLVLFLTLQEPRSVVLQFRFQKTMVSFRHMRSTWAKVGEIHSACSLWWVFLQKCGNKVITHKMFPISLPAKLMSCH